jgi:shikimate kinase
MNSNIALVGFMGAGKSTVGRLLAEKLKMGFIETDSLVEQKAGKSVEAIFKSDGEAAFRHIEAQAVADAAHSKNTVISCGGGAVLDPANVQRLKETSVLVYLKVEPDIVLKRVSGSRGVRPLLEGEDPSRKISDLLESRRKIYEDAADIEIDTSKWTVEEVAGRVMAELQIYESVNLKK